MQDAILKMVTRRQHEPLFCILYCPLVVMGKYTQGLAQEHLGKLRQDSPLGWRRGILSERSTLSRCPMVALA